MKRGNSVIKRADRWFGVPLLGSLAMLRRRRPLPACLLRVGVLKEAAIGDTVMLAAALHDLRLALPSAHITVFAGDSNYEFAKLLQVPDEVVWLPLGRPLEAARLIGATRPNALLDFGQWPRINAIIAALVAECYTVGFRTPNQYRHYAYDAVCEHRPDVHELVNFRALVRTLIPSAASGPVAFPLRLEEPADVQIGPYAVVHMWPGGERSQLKEWPAEYWREVIDHLLRSGLSVVLTGGASDRAKNDGLLATLVPTGNVRNAAGLPLTHLPALLLHSALTISVNTGLMHLASAIGTPTVGLHGPTSASRWGPCGPAAIAVVSDDPLAGYLHLGFEYPSKCEAMRRLPPAKVIAAIKQLMDINDGDHVGRVPEMAA